MKNIEKLWKGCEKMRTKKVKEKREEIIDILRKNGAFYKIINPYRVADEIIEGVK